MTSKNIENFKQKSGDRYYIVFDENYPKNSEELINKIGVPSLKTVTFFNEDSLNKMSSELTKTDILYYPEFGFALVTLDDDDRKIIDEKEIKDYKISLEETYEGESDTNIASNRHSTQNQLINEWGLNHINISQRTNTGSGIKVAILDTGIDFKHPEFQPKKRTITSHSFISATAQDDHGHGTHCAGTLCAKKTNNNGKNYGVAPDVDLHVCKVLNKKKKGLQNDVILGILWALNKGCSIISLSFSNKNPGGRIYDIKYERMFRKAKKLECFVFAAAGNHSLGRPHSNKIDPIGSPADCPSAYAITAIDSGHNMYQYSNRADVINLSQKVAFTAPGRLIKSSWFINHYQPTGFMKRSGTSMAVPFVAGVFAILKKKHPTHPLLSIENIAKNKAKKLPLLIEDQGSGLIQL